jgi:A/G-specific adenine glycosylase
MSGLSLNDQRRFLAVLNGYYQQHGRNGLPWRLPEPDGSFDAYKILVSELMLQQTQVPRVVPMFQTFLQQFPTFQALAGASLGDVLKAWQGLGYNRRAKFLWQAAQMVVRDFAGTLPRDQKSLEQLPGVGPNTAGAIRAYAYNEPALFIETNIRTVYIHHFFKGQSSVPDAGVRDLLAMTLDRSNPRQFYWAMMDYGSYLKQAVGNLSRVSKSYAKQSKFDGSLRQVRGRVLRLLANSPMSKAELLAAVNDQRTEAVLHSLLDEGLIAHGAGRYQLP